MLHKSATHHQPVDLFQLNLHVKVGGGTPALSEHVMFRDWPSSRTWSDTGWLCTEGSTVQEGERGGGGGEEGGDNPWVN